MPMIFTVKPKPPTARIMIGCSMTTGWKNLWMASMMMKIATQNKKTPFMRPPRTSARPQPYDKMSVRFLRASLMATNPKKREIRSESMWKESESSAREDATIPKMNSARKKMVTRTIMMMTFTEFLSRQQDFLFYLWGRGGRRGHIILAELLIQSQLLLYNILCFRMMIIITTILPWWFD